VALYDAGDSGITSFRSMETVTGDRPNRLPRPEPSRLRYARCKRRKRTDIRQLSRSHPSCGILRLPCSNESTTVHSSRHQALLPERLESARNNTPCWHEAELDYVRSG
jgi:hypothetical protein